MVKKTTEKLSAKAGDKKPKPPSTAVTASLSPDGSLSRYLREIRKYPMLEAQQEFQLAKDYLDHDDTSAAHMLVTSHLRLVAKIATGYRGYGLPLGEVIQEGNVGLMKAVKKFDPDKGFRLATYAMWWIRASIQEYVLRSWSLVKIGTTSAQKKLFFNLRRLKSEMNAIDGGYLKPDQVKKIATKLGVTTNEVTMMDGRMSGGDSSLNAPMRHEGEEGAEWQDWIVDESDSQEMVIAERSEYTARQKIMLNAMGVLKAREKSILTARRLTDPPATLEELSHEHNVSRERIRQIEARAFEKLREAMMVQAPEIADDGDDSGGGGHDVEADVGGGSADVGGGSADVGGGAAVGGADIGADAGGGSADIIEAKSTELPH